MKGYRKLTMFPLISVVSVAVTMVVAFLAGSIAAAVAGAGPAPTFTMLLVVLVAIPFIVRAWRVGVWSNDEELVSRMVFRTTRVRWSDVRKLDTGVHRLVDHVVTDAGEFPVAAASNPLGVLLYGEDQKLQIEYARH